MVPNHTCYIPTALALVFLGFISLVGVSSMTSVEQSPAAAPTMVIIITATPPPTVGIITPVVVTLLPPTPIQIQPSPFVIQATATALPTLESEPVVAECMYYTVQAGDTLFSIAMMFGIDLQDLMIVNQIDETTILEVGQELAIGDLTSCPPPLPPTWTPVPTS